MSDEVFVVLEEFVEKYGVSEREGVGMHTA